MSQLTFSAPAMELQKIRAQKKKAYAEQEAAFHNLVVQATLHRSQMSALGRDIADVERSLTMMGVNPDQYIDQLVAGETDKAA